MSSEAIVQNYLDDSRSAMRAYKKLAEKAIAQVKDEEFFIALDQEANSVAVVMKHMAGNMISRWTDFLTSDGEKPDRNRDMEFVIEPQTTKDSVIAYWERGWKCVFDALAPLRPVINVCPAQETGIDWQRIFLFEFWCFPPALQDIAFWRYARTNSRFPPINSCPDVNPDSTGATTRRV